jgi:UDP-N-acetylmuramoylalanine--D-glutamate ligase
MASAEPTAAIGGTVEFADRSVLVCGAGLAGISAARALLAAGARVRICADISPRQQDLALAEGAEFVGALAAVPAGTDLVVTSPGLPPRHPVLADAATKAIAVLGELELAWRLRGPGAASWLMVTGTNGKTTTVRMLESILTAAGIRALAVGNVGVSVIDAVLSHEPYELLVVEASSFQLHYASTISPLAGALLNLAEDHLDWHGSMFAYAEDKAKVWNAAVAVGNADDLLVIDLLSRAPAPRTLSFTLAEPQPLQFGVRNGQLVTGSGAPLLPVSEVRPPGPHNVANALAAAALATVAGVSADRIAAGLRFFVPDPHRNQLIASVGGVRYVDDSKATNPHAAAASLTSFERIVWIAGGQLKGASVEQLVAQIAPRLSGAVLLGIDREEIRVALARHAPDLPVIVVSRTDDGAMPDVVTAATSLAAAGDVVMLAPAAASKDMFADYGVRGSAFADAVLALPGAVPADVSSAASAPAATSPAVGATASAVAVEPS